MNFLNKFEFFKSIHPFGFIISTFNFISNMFVKGYSCKKRQKLTVIVKLNQFNNLDT